MEPLERKAGGTQGPANREDIEPVFVPVPEEAGEHGLVLTCQGSGQLDPGLEIQRAAAQAPGDSYFPLKADGQEVGLQVERVDCDPLLCQCDVSLAGDPLEVGHGEAFYFHLCGGPLRKTNLQQAVSGDDAGSFNVTFALIPPQSLPAPLKTSFSWVNVSEEIKNATVVSSGSVVNGSAVLKRDDGYFIYVEIGVILGARLGYILFYDPHTLWYLTHPWEIFNPFHGGTFTGISGMSYHGAVIGFLIATWLFVRRSKTSFWMWMDLVALSVPVGYIFGRIGNFLNQGLVGRVTEVPWGIYVNGTLRHPSQLYEAFLEGVLVASILFLYRKRQRFEGELIALYAILYGTARFVAEFWRQPDIQLGFICCGWLSMGQLLCALMMMTTVAAWGYAHKRTGQGQ